MCCEMKKKNKPAVNKNGVAEITAQVSPMKLKCILLLKYA
ncbi:unnamed protein product [Larinioides sclopetarius]|uniref:Uncharacterized protein n=1 Tax=Larinioides sclopetarius TaxID=280406 RepID=A0AAV2BKG0_9ARAC